MPEIVRKHPLFWKLCVGNEELYIRTPNQTHGCSIDICVAILRWRQKVLNRNVMNDETWVTHFNPNIISSINSNIRYSGVTVDLCAGPLSQTVSARKVHDLMRRKGHSTRRLLVMGATVKAERYCTKLENLRQVIKNMRREILKASVMFIHDKALQNSTAEVSMRGVWIHTSSDLAPSNFHKFMHTKKIPVRLSLSSGQIHADNCNTPCPFQVGKRLWHWISNHILWHDKCFNFNNWEVAKILLYHVQWIIWNNYDKDGRKLYVCVILRAEENFLSGWQWYIINFLRETLKQNYVLAGFIRNVS